MPIGSQTDYTLPDAPDPLHYVPLPDHERALVALCDALACGMTRIALLGPPGFGKSLLLRRLKVDPPPGSRVAYVPFVTLEAEELAPWVLSWMGAQAGPLSDDEIVAWARVEQRLGRRCVLLLDEAQSLPHGAAQRLDEWIARAQGAVQVVLCGVEGQEFSGVLEIFGSSLHRVGLRKPLRGEALRGFADALIERSVGARGGSPTWVWQEEELFEATSGVPRLVKAELRKRLETAERRQPTQLPSAAVAAAQRVALPALANAPPAPEALQTTSTPAAHRARSVPPPRARRSRARLLPALALLALLAFLMMPSTQEPAVSASPAAPSAALVSPTVSLNVNAHPWARIAIDGHAVGITPLAEVQVAPGFHQATATFPDGREVVRRFEAQAPSVSLSFP